MGFFERLSRLLRSNLNDLVSKVEDPVKILDQSLADMQEDLVKLRQAVAMAIAALKRLESQADHARNQSSHWYERAGLALKNGKDELAREALSRKKTFQDSFSSLTCQVQSQSVQVEKLKKSLLVLESKIAEARTKKDMLKARAQAAKAQQQIQSAVGGIGTNSAMDAFERMEDKVEALEASGMASAELAGSELESQFAALEGGNEMDDELEALRRELKSGVEAVALPEAEKQSSPFEIKEVKVEEVDDELEKLRRSLDQS